MKAIKKFDEFIKQGIAKKQAPDKSRAEFLVKEARQNYLFILELRNKFEIKDSNANAFIKSCYDVLMGLIRAKMLLEGYNASGFGAHEAEISYLRILGFNEKDVQFADQIRFFRNGMLYYGTMLNKEYAKSVFEFLNKNYPILLKLID